MSAVSEIPGEQLADALHRLGVGFVMGGKNNPERLHRRPARLIEALAGSSESRLRLALIPLFLEHPEFAKYVRGAAGRLDPSACLTLQCYYSAAVWLQQLHRAQLEQLIGQRATLPDYFADELQLARLGDPEENLGLLAERQRALSGSRVNWLGTYKHAAQVWLKGLEIQGA